MPDRLSALLQRFELRARVIYGSALCGVANVDVGPGAGHLHPLHQVKLGVTDGHLNRDNAYRPLWRMVTALAA